MIGRSRDESYLLGDRHAQRPRMSLALLGLTLLSVGLLVLSRLDHGHIRLLRTHILDVVVRPLATTQAALAPFQTLARRFAEQNESAEELARLRQQVQELESWKWRAEDLARRLDDLAHMNRVVIEPAVEFATARVVATATGVFAASAVVAAGRAHGVKVGFPVVNGDGVVGRVIAAGETSSRVLLVTDPASRVPVDVGDNEARAIMTGDGGARPRLQHVASQVEPKAGDEVLTSGIGGLFPKGLRVGALVDVAGNLRVKPYANLEMLDYVSILFVETPALELTDRAAPPRRRRDVAGRVIDPDDGRGPSMSGRDAPSPATPARVP